MDSDVTNSNELNIMDITPGKKKKRDWKSIIIITLYSLFLAALGGGMLWLAFI